MLESARNRDRDLPLVFMKEDIFDTLINSEFLDLRVGNPQFLQEFWKQDVEASNQLWRDTSRIAEELLPQMDYPSQDGDEALKESIKALHKDHKNVKNIDGKYIVIANGSTQILQATFLALKQLDNSLNSLYIPEPFWPRLAVMGEFMGLKYSPFSTVGSTINLYTIPNNPDGAVNRLSTAGSNNVLDLNYNWSIYATPIENDDGIAIYGISKLSGFASTRIGWGIFKDKTLADMVSYNVEVLTSGISLDAQLKAKIILDTILENKDTFFKFGQDKLIRRHALLNKLLHDTYVQNRSVRGMFWLGYSVADLSFLDKAKILYVPGASMVPNNSFKNNFFRINIGCSDKDFEEMMRRLKAVL